MPVTLAPHGLEQPQAGCGRPASVAVRAGLRPARTRTCRWVDLEAQRLTERADAVLGQRVDGRCRLRAIAARPSS